ncbi:riboflavin synthase subunit alpha [Methylovorus sp. MM2]|uniref:riboflavin synthase n=1 Tax=Methylovorus sp. MM2 TaxID=1848038 RepID=UPI0007E1DECA|nr:riboflavin synthase [Methylovorus sp. MM2]OAM51369.1 riboflavin synthase subunit alpha [Methylovorus sp. MM2]
MFTGIVQALGQITEITPLAEDLRLRVDCGTLDMSDVAIGDSICVNGVCLTAISLAEKHFEAHVSKETLSCTVGLDTPRAVNLEKALRFSDRLGGHIVSGHVDGVGQIVRFEPVGDCILLAVRAPHALSRYVAIKGSITIDGVSLTVNTVDKDSFSVNLIPHTLSVTSLKSLGVGSRVNLEVDLIARYVDRMTQWNNEGDSA